jgi:S-layer homology domain
VSSLSHRSRLHAALITLGASIASIATMLIPATSSVAQKTTFSDVPSNYWARPFIERLAIENIVAGYPDGTFRPEQTIDRDELAAMIRDAFGQTKQVKQIPSGSVFKDVPANYWAASAIEQAYEKGFMQADDRGFFRPKEEVSRLQALQALVNGLNLSPKRSIASTSQVTHANKPQTAKRFLFPPLAITNLMQPVFIASRNLQTISSNASTTTENISPSTIVSNYYQDADRIPQNAVDEVAKATQAHIVVNYPKVKVLNPDRPLDRATAAAWIHQTLVSQKKLPPIPGNTEAYRYIANPVNPTIH